MKLERYRSTMTAEVLHSWAADAQDELDRLAACEVDARRYRWLRAPTSDVSLVIDKLTGYDPGLEGVPGTGGPQYEYRAGDELDAAIDAAMPSAPLPGGTKRVAPWPDFNGKPIHEGDRILHPSGESGVVAIIKDQSEPEDMWRIIYSDGSRSRLCLQVGDKGRGVVFEKLGGKPPVSVMPAEIRARLDAQRKPWDELDDDVQSLMDRDRE